MKIDWTVFTTVIVALVVYKIIDKMFLDNAMSSVFNWESEGYEE